jgi:hypothetical protein
MIASASLVLTIAFVDIHSGRRMFGTAVAVNFSKDYQRVKKK